MNTGRAVRPSMGSPETKKDTVNGVLKTLKVNTRPTIITSPSMSMPSPSTPLVQKSSSFGPESGGTRGAKINTRPVMISSPSMSIASSPLQATPSAGSSESGGKISKISPRPPLMTSPSMTIRSQQPFNTTFASPATTPGQKELSSNTQTSAPITSKSAPQVAATPTSSANTVVNPVNLASTVKIESTPTRHSEAVTSSSPVTVIIHGAAAPSSPGSSSLSSSGAGSVQAITSTNIPTTATSIAAPSPSAPSSSSAVQGEQQIKVAVRVRPLLPSERDSSEKKTWEWTSNSIQLLESEVSIYNQYAKTVSVKQAYQFDHLFTPESTNETIFDNVVRNIVQSAMEGFHGSVFTYGQTSSGKTFTMNGDKTQPGIIPQAIAECFDRVQSMPGRDFILRVSYLEVYNEQIKDLLSMEPVPVRIQHDPKRGTVLSGVKEQVVLNTQQVLALIKSGEAHRHVGSTDMNEKSSRAHTLFKIIIESTSSSGKEPVRVSSLYLVDLAGSESAKMTNSKGERAREAKHINQSLLTLSTIIQRLSEDRQGSGANGSAPRKQHLPYRDSKLTRILESALDGNAQIGIICTVSPTFKCVDETSNTLKFASRAKMIKMSAKINETIDDKTLLRVYKEEIEQLRVRLQELETQTRQSALNYAANARNNIGNSNADTPTMLTRSSSRDSLTAEQTIAAAEEEDANLMLQMIAEMERLILRADVSKSHALPRVSRKASKAKMAPERGDGIAVAASEGGPTREKRRAKEGLVPGSSRPRSQSAAKKASPKSESKRKLHSQSNAAMLSMFVEAADSDEIVRFDTNDEFDLSSHLDSNSDSDGSSSSDEASLIEGDFTDTDVMLQPKEPTKRVRVVTPSTAARARSSSEEPSAPQAVKAMPMSGQKSAPDAPLPPSLESSPAQGPISPAHATAQAILERRSSASSLVDSQHKPLLRMDTFLVNGKASAPFGSTGTGTGTGIPRVLRPQTVRAASLRAMSASIDDDDLLHVPSERPNRRRDSFEDSGGDDSSQITSIWNSENENLPDLTRDPTPGLMGAFADSIEDDSVLLGVSKMLMVLKGHVSKARARHGVHGGSSGDLNKLEDSPVTTPGKHERRESRELPLLRSPEGEVAAGLKLNEKFDYERLKLDFKLKEADNRFLQEELENKNKMLTMLTEGLKEVELSQTQWLTANQDLSYELEKALFQNKCLKSEISKLREQLHLQQRSDIAPEIAKVLLNSPTFLKNNSNNNSCASIPEGESETEGDEAGEEQQQVSSQAALRMDSSAAVQGQQGGVMVMEREMPTERGLLRTKQIFVESADSDTSDSEEEA